MKLFLVVILFCVSCILIDSAQIQVKTSKDLKSALLKVKPGDTINLDDGTYTDDKFTVTVSGTKSDPITLKGSSKAILTTGDINSGYGLYFNRVNYWKLVGFSVKTAQKVSLPHITRTP
jgi:hypothetical protein